MRVETSLDSCWHLLITLVLQHQHFKVPETMRQHIPCLQLMKEPASGPLPQAMGTHIIVHKYLREYISKV